MFGIQFFSTPKNVVENYLLKDITPDRYYRKTGLLLKEGKNKNDNYKLLG